MINWKPNKDKNCTKCVHCDDGKGFDEYGYPNDEAPSCDFASKYSGHDTIINKNGTMNFNNLLASIIENIFENWRDESNYFDNYIDEKGAIIFDSFHIFLANICPLYKEE